MSALDLFRLAFGRLGTGRLRTALTMLGVVIGVASVVALVAVGQGATSGISSRLQGLGTNLLTVNAGASFTGFTRGAAGSSATLKLAAAGAIGTDVTIGGLPFRVVGILQAKGGTGFQSPDDQVLIPVSTASALIVGGTSVRSVGVSVANPDQMTTVSAEITAALRERNGLTGTAADDFTIQNQDQLLATVSSVSTLLTVLLAGIASISLIVGGIGIMNIMLVSVRERTREIGIRKAIGARGRDILAQFLIEALALSLAGGLFGIVIGLAISF